MAAAKEKKRFELWQILYPIAIYYVVSSLAYFGLEALFGVTTTENYMTRQTLSAAISIPFILKFYMQDQRVREAASEGRKFRLDGAQVKNIILVILTAGASAIAVNNLIAMTPMVRISEGFQNANASFFGGGLLPELLGSCLVIPLAEELLYRGVVYRRLRESFDVRAALLISAFIFGVVHANLVQFFYAALLGLLLAFLYEKTGYFYAPLLGHITANAVAVMRTETEILSFAYEPTAAGIAFTLAALAVAVVLILYQVKEYQASQTRQP